VALTYLFAKNTREYRNRGLDPLVKNVFDGWLVEHQHVGLAVIGNVNTTEREVCLHSVDGDEREGAVLFSDRLHNARVCLAEWACTSVSQ
jgi:hypothetical protein